MPENQKDKKDGPAGEDQKERGYYYDDAHGYEEYDPEDDSEDDPPSDRSTGDSVSEERRLAPMRAKLTGEHPVLAPLGATCL